MVTIVSLRNRLPPGCSPGRDAHDGCDRDLRRLAGPGPASPSAPDARTTRLAPGCLSLSPAAGQRLLRHPAARSLPASLPEWPQGRPDRALAPRQSADRLPPAAPLRQGGHPTSPPPSGRPTLRQTPATLCRTHCRVPLPPPRSHPRRRARLHRPHLRCPCRARRSVQVPQTLRSRSRHTPSHCWVPGPSLRPNHARHPTPRTGPRAVAAASVRTPRPAGTHTGTPLFGARTHYAGAFLLMPQALDWLATAQTCCPDDYGTLQRGFLTSAFALVVGLERLWHLDEMADVGFALLTGGRRCPSRHTVGGWRRHLRWQAVDAFCRRTSPWHLVQGEAVLASYDEHTIPRWTRKFRIRKGYVTTRNKHMRCEKLFYTYDLHCGRYLAVRATPGDWGLNDLALSLTRQTLTCGQPDYLHALFDAGAGPSDAAVRALWDLVEAEHPRLDVTLRACRYPHRVRAC